jgi:hypothetical protein
LFVPQAVTDLAQNHCQKYGLNAQQDRIATNDREIPSRRVSANLHRLKEIMETGSVTDTSYSVAGKFAQRPNQHKLKK